MHTIKGRVRVGKSYKKKDGRPKTEDRSKKMDG